MLTASLSGFAAVSFVLCNSLFIPLWTHGKIQWPVTNDVLLGIWMIVLAVLHCHNSFVLLTKKIGFLRWVYFVEGIVFVTLSLLVARRGGLPAIIACSIVCSILFSGAYGVRRISRYFNSPSAKSVWTGSGPWAECSCYTCFWPRWHGGRCCRCLPCRGLASMCWSAWLWAGFYSSGLGCHLIFNGRFFHAPRKPLAQF